MPDSRVHRGAHPEDAELFSRAAWPRLQNAVGDYSWLLDRGYASPSAIKIVGDRYKLNQRQRTAVMRGACSNAHREARQRKQIMAAGIAGQPVWIDGFNVLTTVEAALGGGVILSCRDRCYRDIASVHGTYRKVGETADAIMQIGRSLQLMQPDVCHWLFDRPVGNSGRLAKIVCDIAVANHWQWQVELVQNPDAVLIASDEIIVTADSIVLDGSRQWLNLARLVVNQIDRAWIIPMFQQSNDD